MPVIPHTHTKNNNIGGGKECDVVEEVRPAALEASAHWTPGPWGRCRVSVSQPATPRPSRTIKGNVMQW